MSQRKVAKVSSLVRYLKQSMDRDPVLHGLFVEGELSNLRMPASGHWYFSLKDEKASISCVMFASANRRLAFKPKSGDKVIINGDVSVYESEGRVQIIATDMKPSGIGDLYQQLEELKKKLASEGLFDADHKKKIPEYAMDIALVTGNNTAAREDVLITLKRRWPIARIHEYPCPVQGNDAVPKIIESLANADNGNHQVILLVRGGGSIEDLWCFNNEGLARFIYMMHTPVITGIGHEIDFTLCDFVSDLRANTPTAAAELAVPDIREVESAFAEYERRLVYLMQKRIADEKSILNEIRRKPVFRYPEQLYAQQEVKLQMIHEKLERFSQLPDTKRAVLNRNFQRLHLNIARRTSEIRSSLNLIRHNMEMSVDRSLQLAEYQCTERKKRLFNAKEQHIRAKKQQLSEKIQLLDAYSPLKSMQRGYSVIYNKDNKIIKSVHDVNKEDQISIRVTDGVISSIVLSGEEK